MLTKKLGREVLVNDSLLYQIQQPYKEDAINQSEQRKDSCPDYRAIR